MHIGQAGWRRHVRHRVHFRTGASGNCDRCATTGLDRNFVNVLPGQMVATDLVLDNQRPWIHRNVCRVVGSAGAIVAVYQAINGCGDLTAG